LVDDISVYDERTIYDATPTLPWWKQRRTKIMLAVMFIVVVTLTTALGVLLSRPDPDPVIIQKSGGGSNVPTISMAPSSSLAPSSSPSECALTVAHKCAEAGYVKSRWAKCDLLISVHM
jgi:hypothetical protein